MLIKLLKILKTLLKWLVGWPRPVLTAQFKQGDIVWYKIESFFSGLEARAAKGYVVAVRINRIAGKVDYLIKADPAGCNAVWREESDLQLYTEAALSGEEE